MKPLDVATARLVLDLSGGDKALECLAETQLEGAVALYNMLADPDLRLGYLADEVGMGKTYVALAVVALMRCFNPSLKVLYVCPSRNVQEKWGREYRNFIKKNVNKNQIRIRTINGKSAVPYVSCRNVNEMIRMSSTGYYADYFVGKDSFSISLANDDSEQKFYWVEKCRSIKEMIPAHEWNGIVTSKREVKEQYAKALNYILPSFDLIIIDEAHNFKHDFESSDRNRVLSRVLGFSGEDDYSPRVNKALLLSATPYDRDINQLRNQLRLVGKQHLLPKEIESHQKDEIVIHLRKFMVRRLNILEINDIKHTRNMYRQEHRRGSRAEIELKSDEQKLVTALVQKKVGEMLNRKDASPAYQIGMMASFESYAQTAKAEIVQFDGDEAERIQKDARDRHVVGHIVESYKDAGLGLTLPHPKMDSVCQQLAQDNFNNKKQLVFVRRVKSVGDLKNKLDDHYNIWLSDYIRSQLLGHSTLQQIFDNLYSEYLKQSRKKDGDISGGAYVEGVEGDAEDNQPPKNDTFFAWFFRGAVDSSVSNYLNVEGQQLTTPDLVRKGLTAKNQLVSLLMEVNWALYITEIEVLDLSAILSQHGETILKNAHDYTTGALVDDYQDVYWACQLGFIRWYGEHFKTTVFLPLLEYFKPSQKRDRSVDISPEGLSSNLKQETFFTKLHKYGLAKGLFPLQSQVYEELKSGRCVEALLEKLDVHCHLISLCIRTGHGIVDLYLSRLRQGAANLTSKTRSSWLRDMISCLHQQADQSQFSTYYELACLAEQLDLVIKNNVPGVFDQPRERRRIYLSHQLNPVSPIIGASGETIGSRSAQARKFRMPGYPLTLVSTNVFQEGEDLHTFCDSVVHYGLSGAPVSIEQKTGRVDRVSSMAQRRLIGYKKDNIDKNDFIQVRFPYVKESIEFLQVRQLCNNINSFIMSLHDVGVRPDATQDIIDTETALADKSEIPEQIWNFLKSPYVPKVQEKRSDTRCKEVLAQCKKSFSVLRHVQNLVVAYRGDEVFTKGIELYDGSHLNVRIDSARGSGETILIAESNDGEYRLSQNELKQWMKDKSWRTFHRTQATETAVGCYRLNINNEMLVGDDQVTQADDIKHFFDRFTEVHNPDNYHKPVSEKIMSNSQRALSEGMLLNGIQSEVKLSAVEDDRGLGLKFDFGHRCQTVLIYEADGLCVFLSKAVTADQLNILGKERDRKIIEYTWVRNCHIDVVDFLLDPDGGISGRAIHPIDSLDWEEFIYCAYVLAVEADRVEYIFNSEDVL